MKSSCASGIACLLPRVSGRRPELLDEAGRTSLGELLVYVYDGSGNLVPQTDAPTPFTSRPLDQAPCDGMLVTATRCYDPSPGRWLERDPVGFEGGDANLCRSVNTEPAQQSPQGGRHRAGLNAARPAADGLAPGRRQPAARTPDAEALGEGRLSEGKQSNPAPLPLHGSGRRPSCPGSLRTLVPLRLAGTSACARKPAAVLTPRRQRWGKGLHETAWLTVGIMLVPLAPGAGRANKSRSVVWGCRPRAGKAAGQKPQGRVRWPTGGRRRLCVRLAAVGVSPSVRVVPLRSFAAPTPFLVSQRGRRDRPRMPCWRGTHWQAGNARPGQTGR